MTMQSEATIHEAGIRDLWRRWFGKPFQESDHVPSEDEMIKNIGRRFESKIKSYGPLLVTKVAEYANEVGLEAPYWPYLYYILEKGTNSWPRLNEQAKTALFFARQVMSQEGDTPPYSGLVMEPAGEDAPAVSEVFRRLGRWASKDLPGKVLRDLRDVMKTHVSKIQRQYPKLQGAKAYAYLANLLEHDLQAHAQWFTKPTRLWGALKLSGVLG